MPFKIDQTWLLGILTVGFIGGAFFIMTFLQSATAPILCKTAGMLAAAAAGNSSSSSSSSQTQLLDAIFHYATSRLTPQQSVQEIRMSMEVLKRLGPTNFLVFGLGYDSLMWTALNLGGTTLFLEDDPKFYDAIAGRNPNITAHLVKYTTKMSEAGELVQHFRNEPDCSATRSALRGNRRCRLALHMLPDGVYDVEWDLILIDGPKDSYAEAPGRMAPIYSAAVMARNRNRSGVTHVFLHDVHRKVEKVYAEMFLCRKYLVGAVGNLWHFQIPPTSNTHFC
ncbi:PREDICTED: probable methyltransferase At1g27930 [Ipomoea nil]|uniref:probable methyltransferase At1g27930 n=1 Tax=Ipomoea nil TaxID=35883 RepID=UPI000901BF1F|nr:PREDICTED: probable methyltransferase At1g27930 [Ipomoea nil]